MKPGTNKLLRTYYFIVDQIIFRFGEDRREDKLRLHNAFKAFYRREYGAFYTSLQEFEKEELNELINKILIEFAVEYGVYLLQPNDPPDAEVICLADYLNYKAWTVKEEDLDSQEAVKKLPDGYVLIKDIEQLKTLKNRRTKNIPENRVWKRNVKLYLYSPTNKIYYRRQFLPYDNIIEKAEEYINKGILYGTE